MGALARIRVAVLVCALPATWAGQQKSVEPAKPATSTAGPVKLEEGTAIAPVDPRTFQLGAEDVILVRVWREPELSGQMVVRPDGQITMPLIGDVQAAGLTPLQLGTQITAKLGKFINGPEVSVSVQVVRSRRYSVTGEVLRPGVFPLVVPTTVLDALTQAGGFREFANTKNITVLRGSKRFKFNYKDVIKGKNMSQNILLEHGDYIVVP